jgi:hypothetical protein
MITITKITSNNETKLIGDIDNFSYCISYTKVIEDKLEELSLKVDKCQDFEEWENLIAIAKNVVSGNPYAIQGSKYFSKINEEFFLSYNGKYYNIKDSRNIIKTTLNYFIDKSLNIDKFAVFIARNGNANLLKLENIYHRINSNGNILINLNCGHEYSYKYFSVSPNNRVVIKRLDYPRYFINGALVSSNSEYTLKSLGVKFKKVLSHDDDSGIPMLIKPDLKCFIGDLEQGGLIVDPDSNIDWDDYITSFIDTYGKSHGYV